MARKRRLFGTLLKVTLCAAVVVLLVLAGIVAWAPIRQAWLHRLARQLRDPSPALRQAAADKLHSLGQGAEAVLIDAVHDPDADVRLLACDRLSWFNELSRQRLEALLRAAHDPSRKVRRAAFRALGFMGTGLGVSMSREETAAIGERLRAGLTDEDSAARCAAATALATYPAELEKAVQVLTRSLSDPEPTVRLACALALFKVRGAGCELPVAALKSLITESVSAPLSEAPISPSGILYELDQLAPAEAASLLPTFIAWVRSSSVPHQCAGLDCLRILGPRARSAIPAIEGLLSHADYRIREVSALTIIEIDVPSAQVAIAALRRMSTDPQVPKPYRDRFLQDLDDPRLKKN